MSQLSAEQLAWMRDKWRKQEEGYRILAEERKERIRSTRFAEVVDLYDEVFELSLQNDIRPTVGLFEYARLMKRLHEQCASS